jgi:16S rRNA processing protein RimM
VARYARIGQIVGVFGIRGQVKVVPETDFLERFDAGVIVRVRGQAVRIVASQVHKGQVLLTLEGVSDPDAAKALQWEAVEGDVSRRPALQEDEYLTEDLIGMRLVDAATGEDLGEVDDVLANPAHDVLVAGDLLVPAVREFVELIDFETLTIRVRLIPGMREG